jgi:hypothetical protein
MLNVVGPNPVVIRSGRLREVLKSANGKKKKYNEKAKVVFNRHNAVVNYYRKLMQLCVKK